MRRDHERINKLRIAVRYLITRDSLERGYQSQLAGYFDVSRQRVHQVVNEERARRSALNERSTVVRAAQGAAAEARFD